MNTIKVINSVNETELKYGIVNSSGSWHNKYSQSCWIYVGGLKFEYSEGDLICVFSQFGEIVNINMIRDRFSGKSKGFCFICYEDQRSTILAVDNFNGIKLGGRTIRVDHVENYKLPPLMKNENDILKKFMYKNGCAPEFDEEIKKLQIESDNIKLKLDAEVDAYEERKKLREQNNRNVSEYRSERREDKRGDRRRSRDRKHRSRSRNCSRSHDRVRRRSRSSRTRRNRKRS